MATPTQNPTAPTNPSLRRLLVDIKQASEMLSISRSMIFLLIDGGQLSPIRIGRSVRFTVEELERFIADRTLASSS